MDAETLRAGYKRLLAYIYRPSHYFTRCLGLLRRMKRRKISRRRIKFPELRAFFHSLLRQTFSHYVLAYWSYLLRALCLRPLMAVEIITMAVKGHHFFIITESLLELERFKDRLERSRQDLEDRLRRAIQDNAKSLAAWKTYRDHLVEKARARCNRLNPDFKSSAFRAFEDFRTATERLWSSSPGPMTSSGAEPQRS